MNTKTESNITSMSFEEALAQLENIVDRLERGDTLLEESIRIYERGEALKKHCEKLLQKAESKVEKIQLNSNGLPEGLTPINES
ncbi:MAG: exodeoxyribonuclease VII small subunit [Candidatus Tokpelaia sp. JSC161]|jgi:exodeoxyribonuclease VII small subunit|nr:MAG: exodeoxyribonuclease VII small subunit [Candidatus Tokpelaia sp. JSC161]